MHNPVNQPSFLDKYSKLKDEQIETINTIVRTQYNRFLGRIEQHQLQDDQTTFSIQQPSWRVTNIKDYNYSGVSGMSFDFDTTGMISGVEYKVIELKDCILLSSMINQSGLSDYNSTFDTLQSAGGLLQFYGSFYFQHIPLSDKTFLVFKAFKGEGDTDVLPSTNWKTTLLFYSEK